jgi:hypothetical protein
MATTDVPGVHRRRPTRVLITAFLATAAMLLATLSTTTVGAQADVTPAEAAASWLADQFVDGERFESEFDGTVFPDYGLTIDAVLALAAAGIADDTAGAAVDWLEQSDTTSGYIGTPDTYAGSLAKLSLLAQVRGLDPTAWGEDSLDLIAGLNDREQDNGRFTDDSEFGDFSNSITQSLAILVLDRQSGEAPSDAAIDLLLLSQCDDGGFTLDLEPAGECASGTDTTSYALQALRAVGRDADADEIADAVGYLLDAQQDSGGFATGAAGTPNANSTGLGVQGLRIAGEDTAADAGAAFIVTLQQDCDAEAGLQGAIDFDGGDFDPSNAARATSQGILGLTADGFATLSADGASADLPRLTCPTTPTDPAPPTTDAGGSGNGTGNDGQPARSTAATPVRATPTFTG